MAKPSLQHETLQSNDHRHLLCWKSTLAGLVISLMAFLMLTTLGAGLAGFSAEGMIHHEEGGSALATSAGLFMGLSVLVALFCGSYFAMRISHFVTKKIGAAHGFVIASLFFFIMVMGASSALGSLVSGFGQLAKGAGGQATDIASNPTVQDAVNRTLGSVSFKADPREVAQGVTLRLMQGNPKSAAAYLAYQSGQSVESMQSKVNELKAEFDDAVKTAGEKTARAVADASLCLLVVMFVGLIGAVTGGRVGAHSNVERPLAIANQRGSIAPYAIGWLMGVPVSLLFLIAVLRSIF